MGLIALAGLLVYVLVGIATVTPVVVSASKSASIPLYWLAAIVAGATLPLLLHQPRPPNSGGEYSGLNYFLAGAFSSANLVCFVGAAACLLLAFAKSDVIRVLSGASWGFLATYIARIVILL